MKSIAKALAMILAAVLAFSLCACGPRNDPKTEEATSAPTPGKAGTATAQPDIATAVPEATQAPDDLPYRVTPLGQAKAGDVVVFGAYEQDGNADNGKEPLEWLVLSSDNGSLLLITLYGIEHMQFHSSLNKVTWETSAVRGWLNNDVLNAAFSSSERGAILTTTVTAEKNPEYPNSPAGNDTEDKVFLLSVQEADQYFADNEARKCSPTEAAIASEPNVFSQMPAKAWYAKHPYGCSWWLRSPGMFKDLYVSSVGKYGDINGSGQVYLSGTDFCVRPAMWIRASS